MGKRKNNQEAVVSESTLPVKHYSLIGTSPILIDGYGRVEPDPEGTPVEFRCYIDPGMERFFLKIGAIVVVNDSLPEGTEPTRPKKPSTPAWLQMETTLDDYED